jgi:hypothetical protein
MYSSSFEGSVEAFDNALRVAEKRFESEVHMLLDMAMKQSQSRLISGEIHGSAPEERNDHRILYYSGGSLATVLGNFK